MAQGANQKLSMWRNCSLEPQGQEFFLAASCGAGDGGTGDAQPALSRLPPRDFICPISLDMMTAPVTLASLSAAQWRLLLKPSASRVAKCGILFSGGDGADIRPGES